MEIYNEDVFDLFEGVKKNKDRTKLKIAENKGMQSFENKQKETFLKTLKTLPNTNFISNRKVKRDLFCKYLSN